MQNSVTLFQVNTHQMQTLHAVRHYFLLCCINYYNGLETSFNDRFLICSLS